MNFDQTFFNGEQTASRKGSLKPLWDHGASGAVVAEHVIDCLNLQPCQQSPSLAAVSFLSELPDKEVADLLSELEAFVRTTVQSPTSPVVGRL